MSEPAWMCCIGFRVNASFSCFADECVYECASPLLVFREGDIIVHWEFAENKIEYYFESRLLSLYHSRRVFFIQSNPRPGCDMFVFQWLFSFGDSLGCEEARLHSVVTWAWGQASHWEQCSWSDQFDREQVMVMEWREVVLVTAAESFSIELRCMS